MDYSVKVKLRGRMKLFSQLFIFPFKDVEVPILS